MPALIAEIDRRLKLAEAERDQPTKEQRGEILAIAVWLRLISARLAGLIARCT